MIIPIDTIKFPKSMIIKNTLLIEFVHLYNLVFSYALDRSYSNVSNIESSPKEDLIQRSAEILSDLSSNFLKDLYIDRKERLEILACIPAKRLIILHGVPGSGKTVLINKIRETLNESLLYCPIYIDFKAISEDETNSCEQDIANIQQNIYAILLENFINVSKESINSWLAYKILNDPSYTSLKEKLIIRFGEPLKGSKWIDFLFSNQELETLYYQIDGKTSLSTLIGFISTLKPIIFLWDNLDRFPLETQRLILNYSVNLSNIHEIPIILALRSANLRRITKTGANGDIIFEDNLESVRWSISELTSINNSPNHSESSLEYLFKLRFDYLEKKGINKLIENYYFQNNIAGNYFKTFFEYLHKIENTFITEDIYEYCNHNIREMLLFYLAFINRLILNPDPTFSADNLVRFKIHGITRLRNYFYKWLILNDIQNSSRNTKLPNIYKQDTGDTDFILVKMLVFLLNQKANKTPLPTEQLVSFMQKSGMDSSVIYKDINLLSINQEYDEKNFLWVERNSDQNTISLLPAGKYFIENLATCREYLFWMINLSSFSPEDYERVFGSVNQDYFAVQRDQKKIPIVVNYLEFILIPRIIKDIELLKNKMRTPQSSSIKISEYYSEVFSINGISYPEIIINSIIKSIKYSEIPGKQKEEYYKKCNQFIDQLKKIIENLG